MTQQQIYLFGFAYLVLLIVVVVLTRATLRRIAGAVIGGVIAMAVLLGVFVLGQSAGLWHMVLPSEPSYLAMALIATVPSGFVFLLTWRIARRFGGRGLLVAAIFVAIIGPVRTYIYLAVFPEWGSYTPGPASVLVISVAYVVVGLLGHAAMRLVAGPAGADGLARRPWEGKDQGEAGQGVHLQN